jgi:hydrogenase expression/formation protein HypE
MTGGRIVLEHGDGGVLTAELIRDVFLSRLGGHGNADEDCAILPGAQCGARVAVTTDAFVVAPYKFRGGDIGKLAVSGTYNDLAVRGAHPTYMAASFILEEGLEVNELEDIVCSMAEEARRAGIAVVAGDTKVVPRGHCDKIFIGASGTGFVGESICLSVRNVSAGDKAIVTGDVGRHGASLLALRLGIETPPGFTSDCMSMVFLPEIAAIQGVHCMRDLTRGGLATILAEIAEASSVTVNIDEGSVPVDDPTKGIAELLGVDPLYLPCEGRAVVFCDQNAEKVVEATLKRSGQKCATIGEVSRGPAVVQLFTKYGGTRRLSALIGAQLPRMC